jgi:signal transduction histidine kinase
LADIFDPFLTTRQESIGLGLSIARTIVHAHRGTIWAENHPEGERSLYFSVRLATG